MFTERSHKMVSGQSSNSKVVNIPSPNEINDLQFIHAVFQYRGRIRVFDSDRRELVELISVSTQWH
jgi:hypothetical protein